MNAPSIAPDQRTPPPACSLVGPLTAVRSPESVPAEADCPLGVWLLALGAGVGMGPAIWEIRRLHGQLHGLARQIAVHQSQGEVDSLIFLVEMFQQKWARMRDLIHAARREGAF